MQAGNTTAVDSRIVEAIGMCIQEVLLQFQALFVRRWGGQLTGDNPWTELNVSSLKNKVEKLSDGEVTKSLKLVQVGLQKMGVRDFEGVLATIFATARLFDRSTDKAAKVALPSTTELVSVTSEPSLVQEEDSAAFCLIQTLHIMVKAFLSSGQRTSDQVESSVITFAYSKLHYRCSTPVREQASLCLGLMSKSHLSAISERFLIDLAAAKSDTQIREYVTYARAHRQLEFGCDGVMQTNATLRYLQKLLEVMQSTDRGVLRAELCGVLGVVLPRVMGVRPYESQAAAWERFTGTPVGTAFWGTYKGIYTLVSKWAKKSKHAVFSHHLLAKMTALANT